jgi:4-hydroxy-2-oxoheptanedioate aldolase
VQIESKEAVARAEQILGVDGVDGCWIGPSDLAYSMGVDVHTKEGAHRHAEAIASVLEACHRTGKIPGIASTPDNVNEYVAQGFRFVTAGGDLSYTVRGGEAVLRQAGREPVTVL